MPIAFRPTSIHNERTISSHVHHAAPPAIAGRNASLRLVEVADARFLFDLRRSPRGRALSPIADDPRAQEEWIRGYKAREARGEEYYFVVEHGRAGDVGALRLYDIASDAFWWGSWIVRRDAPRATALESMFLVYELGFFGLDRACARFVVRKDNPTRNFHPRVGARITAEDEARVFFELTRERWLEARPRFARRFARVRTAGAP